MGSTKSITMFPDVESAIQGASGSMRYIRYNAETKDEKYNESPDLQEPQNLIRDVSKEPDRWISIDIQTNVNPLKSEFSVYDANGTEITTSYFLKGSIRQKIAEKLNAEITSDSQALEHGVKLFYMGDLSSSYSRTILNTKDISARNFKELDMNVDLSEKTSNALGWLRGNTGYSAFDSSYIEELESHAFSNMANETASNYYQDVNTNEPISIGNSQDTNAANTEVYINEDHIHKLIKASRNGPLKSIYTSRDAVTSKFIEDTSRLIYPYERTSSMFEIISAGMTPDSVVQMETESTGVLYETGDPLNPLTNDQVDTFVQNNLSLKHIGFYVNKYEVVASKRIYKGSKCFIEESTTDAYSDFNFKDPNIVYGSSYVYEIRDFFIAALADSAGSVHWIYIIGETPTEVQINTFESKPPPPPSDFRFSLLSSDLISVQWKEKRNSLSSDIERFWPANRGAVNNYVELDDVAGFLVFLRNSLDDCYELIRLSQYDDLGDTLLCPVVVSNDIVSLNLPRGGRNSKYSIAVPFASNRDYYLAMASYDVHGNISYYSEQYYFRRNSITGEMDIKIICSEGAPLAYPNFVMPGKLVKSSMKVSGYKKVDIYQTPFAQSRVARPENFTFHMIDLNTESDVILQGEKAVNDST